MRDSLDVGYTQKISANRLEIKKYRFPVLENNFVS